MKLFFVSLAAFNAPAVLATYNGILANQVNNQINIMVKEINAQCPDVPQECVGKFKAFVDSVATAASQQSVPMMRDITTGFFQSLNGDINCQEPLMRCAGKLKVPGTQGEETAAPPPPSEYN